MTRARDKASAVVANFASTGIDDNADATAITIDSSENVGMGTTPAVSLHVKASAPGFALQTSGSMTSGNRADFSAFNSDTSTVGLIRFGAVTDNVGTNVQFHSRPAGGSLTERMRILSSGGITFNGDTAAANALDDYEEGTFTPVIKYGAGSSFTTITSPNNAIGAYRKIGALLYISFYVYKNSSPIGGSGGTWRVQGIPFTLVTGSTGGYQSIPVGYWSLNSTNYFNSIPTRWQANGSDFLDMYGAQATTAWSSGNYEVAGHGVLMTT